MAFCKITSKNMKTLLFIIIMIITIGGLSLIFIEIDELELKTGIVLRISGLVLFIIGLFSYKKLISKIYEEI